MLKTQIQQPSEETKRQMRETPQTFEPIGTIIKRLMLRHLPPDREAA
jgi:hypothetical protein